MKEVYVHTLRYHYGTRKRRSKIMFPVFHGPFRDEDSAWEGVRQSGITPGQINEYVCRGKYRSSDHHLLTIKKERKFSGSLSIQPWQNAGD